MDEREQEDRGLRDAVMVVVVNHMDRYHGGWWEGDAEMVDRILDLLAARPAAEERDRLAAEVERLMDGMEAAWGVIANVSSGRWDRQSPEWRDAAHRWRDEHWHRALAPERES
jgi:hypothetical protein